MSFPWGISPHTTLHTDLFDSYGNAVPVGMPAFVLTTPLGLPQYSSLGRMEPEFLGNDINPEDGDEDERPIVARGRTTRILGFAPREGWTGTRVTVRLLFRQGHRTPKNKVSLRVMMGNILLDTSIGGIAPVDGVGGEWRLEITAPDAVELDIAGIKVPLIVQVMDKVTKQIVDDVCIGSFQFKQSAPVVEPEFNVLDHMDLEKIDPQTEDPSPSSRPDYARLVSTDEQVTSHRSGELPSCSMANSVDAQRNSQAQTAVRSARKRARLSINVPQDVAQNVLDDETSPEAASPTVVRNPPSQSSQRPGEDTYPVTLSLHGDLSSMTEDWTNEEIENNRRVVEFVSVQKRGNIDITFGPLSGADVLDASKNVVSCIWWEDIGEFVITSVDTINLLERLVGTKFSTEEKNRIRRNLQGFKPATVSKNHPESKQFFQMLMEFPIPRPRNIEKDVKAFRWSKLESMLEKVVSKYWFVTSPRGSDSEDQGNSPGVRVVRDPDSMSADSPNTVGLPLSTTQTPTSTQQSQSEARTPQTGTVPSSGYFMPIPSTPGHHTPLDSYVGSLESSVYTEGPGMGPNNNSMYAEVDSLMEISEASMQDLHAMQMGANHHGDIYHEQTEPYPDNLGISSNIMYEHDIGTGTDALGNEVNAGMPYMAHTSQEYA